MLASTSIGELSMAQLLILAASYVVIILGLVISYIAYRGYRRNDSRPMLYIAIGFVLVTGVPGLIGTIVLFTPLDDRSAQLVGTGIDRVSTILGMLAILYALRSD